MFLSGNPHADFDAWDGEREKALEKLPVCACCIEPIQDEELYDFDGELICEECVADYIKEKYKKKTYEYMEE